MPDPAHVAIIMDGNGRWAGERGLERTAGHAAGEHALFDTVEGAVEQGLDWLTVYAFSTENWSRSPQEVEFLMEFNDSLLVRRRDEVDELGVHVHFIGDWDDERVPDRVRKRMKETEELTASNTTMGLVFAFNYGGRHELVRAVKRIAAAGLDADSIDVDVISAHLDLPEMPDPDLIIRTSGEQRLSNFLLWQSAYSELVFSDVLWPDFDRAELARCIDEYSTRKRRFGKAE
ncbi:MAG: polyprenyl diphosphate synthase [Acidimicrobiia bacterium]|nr:polyprenyl diphosphate synthase [Acidimicrobiia bacterium]MDH3471578.1 polyprenyl diphosphate synthase [Acidimicrobiia bacterium]